MAFNCELTTKKIRLKCHFMDQLILLLIISKKKATS